MFFFQVSSFLLEPGRIGEIREGKGKSHHFNPKLYSKIQRYTKTIETTDYIIMLFKIKFIYTQKLMWRKTKKKKHVHFLFFSFKK